MSGLAAFVVLLLADEACAAVVERRALLVLVGWVERSAGAKFFPSISTERRFSLCM